MGAERLRRWGRHPAGPVALLALAVAEATVFPAPTEALLVALVLAAPGRTAWWIAVATIGSVGGGVLGYAAGTAIFEGWGAAAVERAGGGGALAAVAALYREHSALALVTSGFTPIPYLVYTGMAGAAGIPLPAFVGFSLAGRALKYAVVGGLAWLLGPAVRQTLERLGPRVAAGVAAALLLAYLAASC